MRDRYVDSSVILCAVLNQSRAAKNWFDDQRANPRPLVGSRLVELEVRRVCANAGVSTAVVDTYLDRFSYYLVDDALFDEAIAIPQPLGSADALHVATALRMGPEAATIITHDARMAAAAQALGFEVVDVVTDDPRRQPVA